MSNKSLSELAQEIREGRCNLIESEGVSWLRMIGPNEWVDWIMERIPNPISLSEPSEFKEKKMFQVLCALRQGPLGSDALNREILTRFEKRMKAGQWLALPIMIVQNDAQLKLYNGTTGVLVRAAFAQQAVVYFDDGRKMAEPLLPKYEVSFCLSVHKSQGSEYEEVVLLFPPGSENLGREALYTGVTRAKKKVNIAIDAATLENILKIRAKTRSGLSERFKEFFASSINQD